MVILFFFHCYLIKDFINLVLHPLYYYGYSYWQYFALWNLISPRLSLLTFLFPLHLNVLAFFPPHCRPVHACLLIISACVCL